MPATRVASPDDIDMASIFKNVQRKLPKLLLVSAIFGALAYAGVSTVAPKYQSQAQLAIVAKGTTSPYLDSKSQGASFDAVTTRMDKEAVNTHVRALKSPDLLEKIAADLKLKDKKEYNSALGPADTAGQILNLIGMGNARPGETERDRVLNVLTEQLEVYSEKESRFIGVQVTSMDPQLAAQIANQIADVYRASLATQVVTEIDDQQHILRGKIEKLVPELASIETEVERYRGQINAFKGGAQNTGLNEQQLSELTAELTRAKASRGEAEARSRSAREMMKLGSADALPDVQKSPLIQNLVQQRVRIERQISELSATLLPRHPRMQQLNADLSGLKGQLKGEISKIVDSLDKEARVAQGREDSIKKSLDDIKNRVVLNAPEEVKLRQLESNAKAKRFELENLQTQLESNRKKLDTRAQPVEAQLISKAQASSVPVAPKKTSLALLVSVATFMLGMAWTITRELFVGARGGAGRTSHQTRPLAPSFEPTTPILAAPKLKSEPQLSTAPVKNGLGEDRDESGQATAIRVATSIPDLAQRMLKQRASVGGHRALITGENQSTVAAQDAIALVKAMAQENAEVILVDWSPSSEGLASLLDVEAKPGLTELLTGTGGFEDVIQKIPGCSVHFIARGTSLDETDVDVDPDQLNLVLDALDEAYDHIVVYGMYDDAHVLFEAIEGRFDAGILVTDGKSDTKSSNGDAITFLGFEVADIDVVRFEHKAGAITNREKSGSRPKKNADPTFQSIRAGLVANGEAANS
jgi:succinoglycan biosynthesis transport protein ExoP